MAINAIQQANIMQVQQVSNTQPVKPAVETQDVKIDAGGEIAQGVAQEVQTVSQMQGASTSNDQGTGSGAQNQAASAALEISQEQNEKKNDKIKATVSEINKKMATNTEAVFGFHEKTNRVTIKIVDKDSKEVIKEFPPDKTLDMIAKAWELAGIMVDEKK